MERVSIVFYIGLVIMCLFTNSYIWLFLFVDASLTCTPCFVILYIYNNFPTCLAFTLSFQYVISTQLGTHQTTSNGIYKTNYTVKTWIQKMETYIKITLLYKHIHHYYKNTPQYVIDKNTCHRNDKVQKARKPRHIPPPHKLYNQE
jgi:hypothetical protein